MNSEIKKQKIKRRLDELPDRGDLSFLLPQNDHLLIRFRKETLCKYLQRIEQDSLLSK